jgi:Sigma-70 factor, region 1.1
MGGELLDAMVSWKAFVVSLLVFGFAPGAVLRLIVLAFPRNDPRRRELLAELYAVPRLVRPYWVFEQLEVALFEGLGERIRKKTKEVQLDEVIDLIALGRERGFLTNEEVIEALAPVDVSAEQMDNILQHLQDENIEVVEMVDEFDAEDARLARALRVKGMPTEGEGSRASTDDPGLPPPPRD